MDAFAMAALTLFSPVLSSSEVVFDHPRFRLTVSDEGVARSLLHKPDSRRFDFEAVNVHFADVTLRGKSHPAASITLVGKELTVGFEGTDSVVTYSVEMADDWILFRIQSIGGTRPERITFLRLPGPPGLTIGTRLNAAWDMQTTICLMAANRQTDCRGSAGNTPQLSAMTQDAPGPKMEGAAVALIVCPTSHFKTVARKASHVFGLLTNEDANGTPVKDTPLVRGSYWFLSFGESEVDKVIDYCEQAGIKQVLLSSGAWCTSPGHYLFDERRYPNGLQSLKSVVEQLHEHGILVGMHTFVSKVSKRDPYVTPIPDRRFWVDREAVLAEAISATQTDIPTTSDLSEWPGSPVAKQKTWEGGVTKHQEVIIDDEIIQYQAIGPEGVWNMFLGCTRGAWGTAATAHAAVSIGRHYGVDGCINGYIIDQETSLIDEVTERIGRIFTECGFDMVYFDGGEDVDRRRFNYYVSNFQEQAMRRFLKRPIIHMGTIMTHLLWHSFGRSSTVDTYLNTLHGALLAGTPVDRWPTVKDHIDKSVTYMLSVRADMMPGELGWFGIWPKGEHTDGLQFDEVEYLMCKSLGYDAPISLQTSFDQMEAHPLTPEILRIVKAYETLRLQNPPPADLCVQLQRPGQDFFMIQFKGITYFPPMQEVPLVGGTHDVRAFVGQIETKTDPFAVATIWHYLREGFVELDIDPHELILQNFAGEDVDFAKKDGRPVIPIGPTRTTILMRGMKPAALCSALENAQVQVRPVAMLFLQAEDCSALVGEMAKGSQVNLRDPEAFGDVIVCTGRPTPAAKQPWYAEYTVDIPHSGRWALWARVRYPSGADESFGMVLPAEKVTLAGTQVLGNCGMNNKQWHWTGRGSGSTSMPPGEAIILKLDPGPFAFRIYAREGSGSAALNPRLDLLCLTDDPLAVPTDEQVHEWLQSR